jgi:hypothetical protein
MKKTISAPLPLHLDTCAAPGIAGTLAVRKNEISKETDGFSFDFMAHNAPLLENKMLNSDPFGTAIPILPM